MEIEKNFTDLLAQTLQPNSNTCHICLSTIDQDTSVTFANEKDKLVFDAFKPSTSFVNCQKCKRRFHEVCIEKPKIGYENYCCKICSNPSENRCLICHSKTGALEKIIYEKKDFYAHKICLFLSSNFIFANQQNRNSFIPINHTIIDLYTKSNTESPKCDACFESIFIGDSYFLCECGLKFHFYCGMYCQSICLQHEDYDNINSNRFPTLQVDNFIQKIHKNTMDLSVLRKMLQNSEQSHTFFENPQLLNTTEFNELCSNKINFTYYEFSMKCSNCLPNSTVHCCYNFINEVSLVICSICSVWFHATLPQCSSNLDIDEEELNKYAQQFESKKQKKKIPAIKPKKKDDFVENDSGYICKICTHYSTLLDISTTLRKPALKPKNLSTSFYILKKIMSKDFSEKDKIIQNFEESCILRQEFNDQVKKALILIKNLNKNICCQIIKESIHDFVKCESRDYFELEQITADLQKVSQQESESHEQTQYFTIIVKILSYIIDSSTVTFAELKKISKEFKEIELKIPQSEKSELIHTYIKHNFLEQLEKAEDYIEHLCAESLLKQQRFFDKLKSGQRLFLDEIMLFLQSKINHEDIVDKARLCQNNFLLCYLKHHTIDTSLETFLNDFGTMNNPKFSICHQNFQNLLRLKIWIETFKQKTRNFLEYYLKSLSIKQEMDLLWNVFDNIEYQINTWQNYLNVQTIRQNVMSIPQWELACKKAQILDNFQEFTQLLKRSIDFDSFLIETCEKALKKDTSNSLFEIFNFISKNKIVVSENSLQFIDLLLMKYNIDNDFEPKNVNEYEQFYLQIEKKMSNFYDLKFLKNENEKRKILEKEIENFKEKNKQNFFSEEAFLAFDQLKSQANKLNIKSDFINDWTINLEYYSQIISAMTNKYSIDSEPPCKETFINCLKMIDSVTFSVVKELSIFEIKNFFSEDLFFFYKKSQIRYIELYVEQILQGKAKPDLNFLSKYCSNNRLIVYENITQDNHPDKVYFTQIINELGQISDFFITEYNELFGLLKSTMWYLNVSPEKIHNFLFISNKLEIKSNIVKDFIVFLFIQRIFLNLVEYLKNSTSIMKGKLKKSINENAFLLSVPIQKIHELNNQSSTEKVENKNIEYASNKEVEMSNFLTKKSSIPTKGSLFQDILKSQPMTFDIKIKKCEIVFMYFCINQIEWHVEKYSEIPLILESFMWKMNSYAEIKCSEANIYKLFTTNNFGNKFNKIDKKHVIELIANLRKYQFIYSSKIGYYEEHLSKFEAIHSKTKLFYDEIINKDIDQLMNSNDIENATVLHGAYLKQQIKSSFLLIFSDFTENLLKLIQNNKSSFDKVQNQLVLLSESVKTAHQNRLFNSIIEKSGLLNIINQTLDEISVEIPQKEIYFDKIHLIAKFLESSSVLSCFNFNTFESLTFELSILSKNKNFEVNEYFNYISISKPKIVFYRNRNIKLGVLNSKIHFLNSYFDNSSTCIDNETKTELFKFVESLIKTPCKMFNSKINSIINDMFNLKNEYYCTMKKVDFYLLSIFDYCKNEANQIEDFDQEMNLSELQNFTEMPIYLDVFEYQIYLIKIFIIEAIKQKTFNKNIPEKTSNLKNFLKTSQIFKSINIFIQTKFKPEQKTVFCTLVELLIDFFIVLSKNDYELFNEIDFTKYSQNFKNLFWLEKEKFSVEKHQNSLDFNSLETNLLQKISKSLNFDINQGLKNVIEEKNELFLDKIGYFQKYLSISKLEEIKDVIPKTSFYDENNQQIDKMLKQAFQLINLSFTHKNMISENYEPKIRIEKIKNSDFSTTIVKKNFEEKIEENNEIIPSEKFKLISNSVKKIEIKKVFLQLKKFVKKYFSVENDMLFIKKQEFDSRNFIEIFNFDVEKNKKTENSPKIPKIVDSKEEIIQKIIPFQNKKENCSKKSQIESSKIISNSKRIKLSNPQNYSQLSEKDKSNRVCNLFLFTGFQLEFDQKLLHLPLFCSFVNNFYDFQNMTSLKLDQSFFENIDEKTFEKVINEVVVQKEKSKVETLMFVCFFNQPKIENTFTTFLENNSKSLFMQNLEIDGTKKSVYFGHLSFLSVRFLDSINFVSFSKNISKILTTYFLVVVCDSKLRSTHKKDNSKHFISYVPDNNEDFAFHELTRKDSDDVAKPILSFLEKTMVQKWN